MDLSLTGQSPQKPLRKGNIVLKNLTKEQKEKLMLGKVGLAGIAMGTGAFALMGFLNKADETSENAPVGTGEAAVVTTQAPFARNVNDEMSFQEAFQTARAEVGPGGFFEYNGKLYNTYTQQEWEDMSPEMQGQYWSSIDQHVTSITDVEVQQADGITIQTPMEDLQQQASGADVQGEEDKAADDVILEVDYLGELDLNEDGTADVLVVSANGNDAPDLIFDDNFDGVADRIVMDVDVQAGITGKEEEYDLEGVDLKVNKTETDTPAEESSDAPVLTVNYITEFDRDGDGVNDVIVVDADGNDTPELLIDRDGDGKADVILFDMDTETGITGNEEIYKLDGVVLDIVREGNGQEADRVTANDVQSDNLSETELNPSANTQTADGDSPNFDNDYDVSDYS